MSGAGVGGGGCPVTTTVFVPKCFIAQNYQFLNMHHGQSFDSTL